MANGPSVCVQTDGPLALDLLMIPHPARWAGLCKLLGLRPENPEKTQLQYLAGGGCTSHKKTARFWRAVLIVV